MSYEQGAAFYEWNGTEPLANNTSITCIRVDDTVTVIRTFAFGDCCNLQEVELPVGLTRLEDHCFVRCKSLKTILLPNSLEEIVDCAFVDSRLEEIKIPPLVTEICYRVFAGCHSLMKVELHSNITLIGRNSFPACKALRSIEFPSSLREIGDLAFFGAGLEQIQLPANVSIGEGAFYNCDNLTKIILPESMGRMKYAFMGCRKICFLQLLRRKTTTVKEGSFVVTEQKLVTELCRKDGQSSMDRIGLGWKRTWQIEKNRSCTVQITCLFSFLNQNYIRILKTKNKVKGSKEEL